MIIHCIICYLIVSSIAINSLEKTWCCEGLGAGGEGDDRRWDGWMASLTRWAWVWVNSGSWWWTGRPGVLWFLGSQRVRHEWVTELIAINNHSESFHFTHTESEAYREEVIYSSDVVSPGLGQKYPLGNTGLTCTSLVIFWNYWTLELIPWF